MRPPKHVEAYADRGLDCEDALEDALSLVEDQALNAGWSREETLFAIRRLVMVWLKEDATRQGDEIRIWDIPRGLKPPKP